MTLFTMRLNRINWIRFARSQQVVKSCALRYTPALYASPCSHLLTTHNARSAIMPRRSHRSTRQTRHHGTHDRPETRQRRSSLEWSQGSSEATRTRQQQQAQQADPVIDRLRVQVRYEAEVSALEKALEDFQNVRERIQTYLNAQTRLDPAVLLDELKRTYSAYYRIAERLDLLGTQQAQEVGSAYTRLSPSLDFLARYILMAR